MTRASVSRYLLIACEMRCCHVISFLMVSLTNRAEGYKHVRCFGLYGTYDDALGWLKSPAVEAKPKTILWLGSSLGNFKRHEVPPFLAGFGQVLQTCDTMLIGIDSCKDPEVNHPSQSAYKTSTNIVPALACVPCLQRSQRCYPQFYTERAETRKRSHG